MIAVRRLFGNKLSPCIRNWKPWPTGAHRTVPPVSVSAPLSPPLYGSPVPSSLDPCRRCHVSGLQSLFPKRSCSHTHVCVKVSWQLLPWVWKGQPPSLPNLTSSLSYDSLSLCHLFCSSLALCLQATTDGVFSDCSWRWLCRAAGVLSCSSPLFSLFYFCLSSSMRTQEPLKENPGGTNCVSRKADSFKGNF